MHDMGGTSEKPDMGDGNIMLNGKITGIGGEATLTLADSCGPCLPLCRHIIDLYQAINWMCEILQDRQRPHAYWKDIEAVGHRVVHGGGAFTQAVCIDEDVLQQIEQLNDMEPLHNPFCVAGIRTLQQDLSKTVPMVGVVDTAFHDTLPEHARTYALPLELV